MSTIPTRREVIRKIVRKLSSPADLKRYLEFKTVSGNEYPWFDFTDTFPRLASALGKLSPCRLDIDTPVFIAGLRRSGSTLFYRVMNGHSQLFLYNERFPGDRMNGRGMPSTNNIYYSVDDPAAFRQTTLRYLGPTVRRRFPRWGCKLSLELAHPDPGSISSPAMDKIVAAYPHARIIGLTRDPRDFVLSALDRGGHDTDWWIDEYKAMMALFGKLAESHADTFLTVRYEDLVLNPEESTRTCCDFAGLSFEERMLDASSWSVKGPREYASKGIVARLDKWRSAEGAERDIVQKVTESCFPAAERYGYAPE